MKYFAEAIGTFALVFCGTGAVMINELTQGSIAHAGIAMTFGGIVMLMVYTFGRISGAHINPAVTIGTAIARKIPVMHAIPYILSQLAGAFAASALLSAMFPENQTLGTTLPAGGNWPSFVLEAIFTFILMIVIFEVTSRAELIPVTGIAIGSTILVGALVAGPVSGGSFNPARSIAPAILSGQLQSLWIYIIAPVLGTCTAAWLWPYFQKARSG